MSYFANTLNAILEEKGISQAKFCEMIQMEKSSLNRYVLSKYRPTKDALEKICIPLDNDSKASLLIAHCFDELPSSAKDLIEILPKKGFKKESKVSAFDLMKLPKNLAECFAFLIERAKKDSNLADHIKTTVKLLKE
jgi:transcriptional regulator with XRE-family HTH domain